MTADPRLRTTALAVVHRNHGAKLAPFAGFEMPITYSGAGAISEHVHTRTHASLFDVSHMGIIHVGGAEPATALERLVPGGITTLEPGNGRYTFFTAPNGGILDDLIVTRLEDRLMIVANAARVDHDVAHLRTLEDVTVELRRDLHLLALQGPEAVDVLTDAGADVEHLRFMEGTTTEIRGRTTWISRSGYTGEDGFELTVGDDDVVAMAEGLLADERVRLAGLAARDSLRLEAGLCLYGNDIDQTTSPIEAGLRWAIPKRRREAGDYPGASVISRELAEGPSRVRVGLIVHHRRPIRHGYEFQSADGEVVGTVTSGGYGPSVDAPIAMGYVTREQAESGNRLLCDARGTSVTAEIVDLPFVPHRYMR